MKPILLSLSFIPYILLGCAPSGGASAQAWEKKIDPRLRAEIHALNAESAKTRSFPVLIKFKTDLSATQKTELEKAGVYLHSQIGDIATAVLAADTISELAKKDYVIYLEASKERSFQTK
ncbi:MAG: hypothetical protein ACREOO_18485 [bacterium]